MKIYQLGYRGVGVVNEEHGGYRYASSKREVARLTAEAKSSDWPVEGVVEINVELTKSGVLRALNVYGGHPDNG
jgi:hypothetical protein